VVSQEDGHDGSIGSDDAKSNDYIRGLVERTGLKLLQDRRAKQALDSDKQELGLFYLFMTKMYWEAIRTWTNMRMKEKNLPECLKELFAANLGLEMGISLVRYNKIENYWSNGNFLGHETFKRMMAQNTFQNIRANLVLYNPSTHNHDIASKDPLCT